MFDKGLLAEIPVAMKVPSLKNPEGHGDRITRKSVNYYASSILKYPELIDAEKLDFHILMSV